jgi:hypothetical protein
VLSGTRVASKNSLPDPPKIRAGNKESILKNEGEKNSVRDPTVTFAQGDRPRGQFPAPDSPANRAARDMLGSVAAI